MIDYTVLLNKHLSHIPQEQWLEFFNERAAVRHFEGNTPIDTAEALAFQDTISYFYLTNHILATTV